MPSRSDPYIYLCLAADPRAVEATQNEFRAGLWQENRGMAINSKKNVCCYAVNTPKRTSKSHKFFTQSEQSETALVQPTSTMSICILLQKTRA